MKEFEDSIQSQRELPTLHFFRNLPYDASDPMHYPFWEGKLVINDTETLVRLEGPVREKQDFFDGLKIKLKTTNRDEMWSMNETANGLTIRLEHIEVPALLDPESKVYYSLPPYGKNGILLKYHEYIDKPKQIFESDIDYESLDKRDIGIFTSAKDAVNALVKLTDAIKDSQLKLRTDSPIE